MIIGEPPASSSDPLLGLSGLMPRRPSRAGDVAIGRAALPIIFRSFCLLPSHVNALEPGRSHMEQRPPHALD